MQRLRSFTSGCCPRSIQAKLCSEPSLSFRSDIAPAPIGLLPGLRPFDPHPLPAGHAVEVPASPADGSATCTDSRSVLSLPARALRSRAVYAVPGIRASCSLAEPGQISPPEPARFRSSLSHRSYPTTILSVASSLRPAWPAMLTDGAHTGRFAPKRSQLLGWTSGTGLLGSVGSRRTYTCSSMPSLVGAEASR